MKNIDFLKKVLMSDQNYWLVAEKVIVDRFVEQRTLPDYIVLIYIPNDVRRGLKYEEITLVDLEKLESAEVVKNIYINTDYAPFQQGIRFYDFYDGFPITDNIKQFLKDALALGSSNLSDYKKLLKTDSIVSEENS